MVKLNAQGLPREIGFVNRGVIILEPLEPYMRWVLKTAPDEVPLDNPDLIGIPTAFLIPAYQSSFQSWLWVEKHAEVLFETKLREWCTEESLWPERRDMDGLCEWFDVTYTDVVWDLVEAELESSPAGSGAEGPHWKRPWQPKVPGCRQSHRRRKTRPEGYFGYDHLPEN